jgi:hypothetical protein
VLDANVNADVVAILNGGVDGLQAIERDDPRIALHRLRLLIGSTGIADRGAAP